MAKHFNQWHLKNTGNYWDYDMVLNGQLKFSLNNKSLIKGNDAGVKDAWDLLEQNGKEKMGSSQITIAVIDDAFDVNHPSLKGDGTKIVGTRDFFDSTYDNVVTTSNVSPRHQGEKHGTACAGLAAGAIQSQILGSCPNARLVLIRYEHKDGYGDKGKIVNAMFKYAIEECKADILSCSWAGSKTVNFLPVEVQKTVHHYVTEYESVRRDGIKRKGVVFCFSAGNDGRNFENPFNPRAVMDFTTHPDVLIVGSSNSRGERSFYSNYGSNVFINAPSDGFGGTKEAYMANKLRGGMMLTATNSNDVSGFTGEDGFKYRNDFSGTSAACPVVAGVCGLILTANPNLSALQVMEIIKRTAVKNQIEADKYPFDANGHSKFLGYGLINAHAAVKMAMSGQSIPEYQANYSGLTMVEPAKQVPEILSRNASGIGLIRRTATSFTTGPNDFAQNTGDLHEYNISINHPHHSLKIILKNGVGDMKYYICRMNELINDPRKPIANGQAIFDSQNVNRGRVKLIVEKKSSFAKYEIDVVVGDVV